MDSEMILATRGSALAKAQTRLVMERLKGVCPEIVVSELEVLTVGDANTESALTEIGGVGVFTREVEEAVMSGRARGAVHSLKDLPVMLPAGFVFGAILERGNMGDVLVSAVEGGVRGLKGGARVGTGSPRRERMLRLQREDVRVVGIRGNVPTRLAKVARGEYDAVILAAAGLERLGLVVEEKVEIGGRELFVTRLEDFLPSPGQAAIAVEVREEDFEARKMFEKIHHRETAAAVLAERAVLAALGGGCHLPLGALGRVEGEILYLEAVLFDDDGMARKAEGCGSVGDPEALGKIVAEKLYEK